MRDYSKMTEEQLYQKLEDREMFIKVYSELVESAKLEIVQIAEEILKKRKQKKY